MCILQIHIVDPVIEFRTIIFKFLILDPQIEWLMII
jgi:hypothetical protein